MLIFLTHKMWQILCNKGHDLLATNDWFQASQSLGSLAGKTKVASKVNVESSGNNYIPRVLKDTRNIVHTFSTNLNPFHKEKCQVWLQY